MEMASSHSDYFSLQTIPYIGTILGGLLPGNLVAIRGFVPEDADR